MKVAFTFIAMLVAAAANAAAPLRDGDIIFQTSRSGQSIAIQKATHSPFSHMGVILHRRYTPLENWIARGDGGRYVVRRLTSLPV